MRTIYKYRLALRDLQTIDIPQGHKFLSVQNQDEQITAWFLVEPDLPSDPVKFRIIGTGWDITETTIGTFLGTAQVNRFVWHVFIAL